LHAKFKQQQQQQPEQKKKRSKYVKNVISLVGEKKNIHTHFGMQTDDAQLHGNHVHKHVSNKWILTISDAHFCTCRRRGRLCQQ
jgi:hypothetical protein